MKSLSQIIEQYLKIKQICIDSCWNGFDYTGKGENRLLIIDSIHERYSENIIDFFGRLNEESAHTPVSREVYMKERPKKEIIKEQYMDVSWNCEDFWECVRAYRTLRNNKGCSFDELKNLNFGILDTFAEEKEMKAIKNIFKTKQ